MVRFAIKKIYIYFYRKIKDFSLQQMFYYFFPFHLGTLVVKLEIY